MTTIWPQIDTSKLQISAAGINYDNLAPTSQQPGPSDGTGAFRTVCMFSHMAFDDPIVYPGQPGKSHLHTFFGNTGTNANSTADSIANTGNSTCRGGTINRTGYWVPTMIDTGSGAPVKPDSLIVYYKTGYNGVAPSSIQVAPQGLRMIAGDPNGSSPVQWGPTTFVCAGPSGDPQTYNLPTDCAVGSVIWVKVTFPQCWDGVNLDSPDHRSHMSYPVGGACPATHPVAIPEITESALYTVTDAAAIKRWRLSSDTYDKSIPAGYSAHADWFNGWKPDVMKTWVTNCDQAAKDCQAHLLGNGYMTLEGQ